MTSKFPKTVRVDSSTDLVYKSIQSEYEGIEIKYNDEKTFHLIYPTDFVNFKLDKHKLSLLGGRWVSSVRGFLFKNDMLDTVKDLYPNASKSLKDTRIYASPEQIKRSLSDQVVYKPVFTDKGKGWTLVSGIKEGDFDNKFKNLDKSKSAQNGRWSGSNKGRWILDESINAVRKFNTVDVPLLAKSEVYFVPVGHLVEGYPNYFVITNVSETDYVDDFKTLPHSRWSNSKKGRIVKVASMPEIRKFKRKSERIIIKSGKGNTYHVSNTVMADKMFMKSIGGRWYGAYKAWSVRSDKYNNLIEHFDNPDISGVNN